MGFRGKIENLLEMDSAKYTNLFRYLKNKVYPEGFTKQDKTILRKFAKKFEVGKYRISLNNSRGDYFFFRGRLFQILLTGSRALNILFFVFK